MHPQEVYDYRMPDESIPQNEIDALCKEFGLHPVQAEEILDGLSLDDAHRELNHEKTGETMSNIESKKDLPVEQRAIAALAQAGIPAIDELKTEMARYSGVASIKVTDKETDAEVHNSYMAVKSLRVDLQKRGKVAREDAVAFQKAVVAAEKQALDIVKPVEDTLKNNRDEWRKAEEARKEAAKNRIRNIEEAIAGIKGIPSVLIGQGSESIANALREAEAIELNESQYQEFLPQAKQAKQEALDKLASMLEEAKKAEAEKAELEKLRAEQAENERKAFEAQQKALAAEQAILEQEKAKIAAEQEAARKEIEQEKAIIAAQQKAEREAKDAEERKARELALAPDKTKLIAAADALLGCLESQNPELEDEKSAELLAWFKSEASEVAVTLKNKASGLR